MSILIRGMEMPVNCCHCPLIGYDPDIEWNDGGRETQGAYICVITHELIDNTKREDHCPLVPIPPHYDLIDHNALKIAVMDCDAETRIDFLKHAMDCINKAPVVIPSDMTIYEAEEE